MNIGDKDQNNGREADKGKNAAMIVLGVAATVLVLTWAVSTLFEFAFLKSLAAVVLIVFGVGVALLMAGFA